MRKLSSLGVLAVLLAGLGPADPAAAALVEWAGTLRLTIEWTSLHLPPVVSPGTGVATVNGSGGAGHLNTLRLAGGLTRSLVTIPITDPNVTETPSVVVSGLGLGTGTLDGISGGPPLGSQNTMPVAGLVKVCILVAGCSVYIPIPLVTANSQVGMGVGGSLTVNTFSKGGALRMSLEYAPWTIGVASIRNITTETPNGAITTYTKTLQGFVHGPASGTSSTATISGVIQIVTPVFIETNLEAPDTYQALWAEVKLHFVPEPGMALLLGCGIAGLLLLGRSGLRKR
jgi:hypothetical protein